MAPEEITDINARCARLLARIAVRDRRAFEELYRLVSAKLNGVALRMLGTQDAAADVLQESFVQIWHNAGSYRHEQGEPMAWMRAIVRYRSLDRIQAGKRKQEDFLSDDDLDRMRDESPASQPDVQTEWDRDRKMLGMCMDRLADSMRESVTMAYHYGYTREEIAERLKMPVNTVKSWLKRGLERLHQCLRQSAI